MVGDAVPDIEAAKGAGCRTIGVTYGYGHPDGADATIDRFADLRHLI